MLIPRSLHWSAPVVLLLGALAWSLILPDTLSCVIVGGLWGMAVAAFYGRERRLGLERELGL